MTQTRTASMSAWARQGALLIVLACAGCTHMIETKVYSPSLASPEEKIVVPVRLVLTDELRKAQWTMKVLGDTWILPLGPNLVEGTSTVVRSVFVNPVITDSITVTTSGLGVKYSLTPKLAFFEQSQGVTAFSQANTSIGIEWLLTDETGRVVWQNTEKGVATGVSGNGFTYKGKMETRVNNALQDALAASQNAMLSSETLRTLR